MRLQTIMTLLIHVDYHLKDASLDNKTYWKLLKYCFHTKHDIPPIRYTMDSDKGVMHFQILIRSSYLTITLHLLLS